MGAIARNAKMITALIAASLGEAATGALDLPPDATLETAIAKVLEVAVIAALVWLVPNRVAPTAIAPD